MTMGKRHLVAAVVRTVDEIDLQVAGPMTGTTIDLEKLCNVATPNIIRHLKAMHVLGETHIYKWVRSGTTWVAQWARGPGKNPPMPKMTREERLESERAKARAKRLAQRDMPEKEITPAIALGYTDEFIKRVKLQPATWYAPLTHYGAR